MSLYITKLTLPDNKKGNEVIIRIQPDGTVLNAQGIHLNSKAIELTDGNDTGYLCECCGKRVEHIIAIGNGFHFCKNCTAKIYQSRIKGTWIKSQELIPLEDNEEPFDYNRYNKNTHSEYRDYWYCSECRHIVRDNSELKHMNYCPSCGAKMSIEKEL